jgi:uncharacterized protein YggE
VKLSALIGVAAAIAAPSAVAAQQAVPTTVEPLVPAAGTVLDISAEGKATRVADLATIRAGVVTQGASAGAALGDNAARMARVLAALKRAGIAARDIATADVSLNPQYRYTDGQPPAITGYQATNSVSVKFRDVAKAGPILDALVTQGANQIDGPHLSVAEPDAALDEARGDALKRARARADLYARAAGMRVARIISINETGQDAGGPNPPVLYARAMAADSRTAIQPGEKDISVTLAVRFLLQ